MKLKSKLSVVSHVVKGGFSGDSGNCGKPADARVSRGSGVLTATCRMDADTLPKQARYQLRYTRLYIAGLSDRPHSIPYSAPVFKSFLHRRPTNL